MPKMHRVVSSNVHSIGYDPSRRKLFVTFLHGGNYVYSNVPNSVFLAFLRAPSKGQYFHRNIKGVYFYSKI